MSSLKDVQLNLADIRYKITLA